MKKTEGILLRIIFILILSVSIISCRVDSDGKPLDEDSGTRISIQPSPEYLSRKAQYLVYCNDNNGPGSGGIYGQACRAYTGAGTFNEVVIQSALDKINNREDCSDFAMNGILRILYLDRRNPTLPDALRDSMNDTVLNFMYWLDEPDPSGIGNDMCWWSENHQILFHTAELLAGILFPDTVFPTSLMTGKEHMEHARPLIHKWLDNRARFGFSEWHSNVYFNEDMPALVNLVDFADEKSIRIKATMILDVLAFDMATNFYKGVFATTHGRTYPDKLIGGQSDSIREPAWIMLDLVDIGSINELGSGNFTGTFLATSDNYWPPPILEKIAEDAKGSLEHRQRDSISIEDGPELYDITYTDFLDVIFWWGMTGYLAPEIVEGSFAMINYYNLWEGYQWKDLAFLAPLINDYPRILVGLATDMAPMSRGTVLETVNTYTYRTPYYQLSGAQDWKPFSWTGQAVMWKATLDKESFIITAMPASFPLGAGFGSDWTGGFVPRVTMHENVGIIQYHIPSLDDLSGYVPPVPPALAPIDWVGMDLVKEWSHAYVPLDSFDEVDQRGNWYFGRKGDAYMALYSQQPTVMEPNLYELKADGRDNVWIIELGDVEHFGSFANFVTAIEAATVLIGSSVYYESPSQGGIEVGWFGPMTVNGSPVDLGPFPRWDNRYSYQEFGTKVTRIEFGGNRLVLDFEKPSRSLFKQ